MQRIDLICKLGAPTALGFILQVTPLLYVLIGIVVWNVFTFFPEMLLLLKIYSDNKLILKKEKKKKQEDDEQNSEENNTNTNSLWEILRTTIFGWKVYFTHQVFLASFAFVLLFCTVLAPGGLFNAFLKIQGIQDWMLGVMTGISGLVGLFATYAQPPLTIRYGPKVTGVFMLWFQFICISFGCICLGLQTKYALFFLMFAVAVARFPLWSFDLIERQIMQLGIAPKERGIVNSVETSMTNVATLVIYLLGSIFADHFIYLAIFSVIAVLLAAVSFSIWSLANSSVKQDEDKDGPNEIEMDRIESDKDF